MVLSNSTKFTLGLLDTIFLGIIRHDILSGKEPHVTYSSISCLLISVNFIMFIDTF